MHSIYKYYKEVTVDYMLERVVKPGFYQLIPPKKLHPASSDTSDKLEQDSVLLPVKLLVSVTFVPLLKADCISTTAKTESSPPQKQRGKQLNTADNTDRYFDAFLL